ncbi:hypothetical protein L3Q82_021009, partial [Scortum barcoo]
SQYICGSASGASLCDRLFAGGEASPSSWLSLCDRVSPCGAASSPLLGPGCDLTVSLGSFALQQWLRRTMGAVLGKEGLLEELQMLSVNFSLFVTLFLLTIKGVSCEDVTPLKKEEFSLEGSTVTLSYNFSKAAGYDYYFFWYRQCPGKTPEFLISHSGTGGILNNPVPGLSVKDLEILQWRNVAHLLFGFNNCKEMLLYFFLLLCHIIGLISGDKISPVGDELTKQPCKAKHDILMGYIMRYVAILTGHRSVVLTHIAKISVRNAEVWDNGQKFQVMADEHKTAATFGQASICLTKEEYSWLRRLLHGTCCNNSGSSDYLLHTWQGNQILKPVHMLQVAWDDAGLTGNITFGQIRTSVATQANRCLTIKERGLVVKAMCHDPKMAEKFYVALADKDEAFKIRKLRLKAMQHSNTAVEDNEDSDSEEQVLKAMNPAGQGQKLKTVSLSSSSSTGDEAEPPYDDHESEVSTFEDFSLQVDHSSDEELPKHIPQKKLFITSPSKALKVKLERLPDVLLEAYFNHNATLLVNTPLPPVQPDPTQSRPSSSQVPDTPQPLTVQTAPAQVDKAHPSFPVEIPDTPNHILVQNTQGSGLTGLEPSSTTSTSAPTEYTPLKGTATIWAVILTLFVWSGLMGVSILLATDPGICVTPFLTHPSGVT